VCILGKMEDSIEESIRMIRNMVMVYTHGQMAEHIQATGAEVNNMV